MIPALRFSVPQPDGTHPICDLTALATGVNNLRGSRKYTFAGRPLLATDFLIPIQDYLTNISPNSFSAVRASLTLLWRFLDAHEHLDVSYIKDLTDVHGSALTLWLSEASQNLYRLLKTIVAFARRYYDLPELFWPTLHDRDDGADRSDRADIDPTALRAVFKALVTEAQLIKEMFLEGRHLAAQGTDPRQGRRLRRRDRTPWNVRENHAWLVHKLALPTIITKRTFLEQGASGLHTARNNEVHYVPGPTYLAPGHTDQATRGFAAKLRWFYPSLFDTVIFYLLFQLTTGWNESTCLNLDVTRSDWETTHWLQPKLKILKSFKSRSNSFQYAVALENAQWRPYQIIRYMLLVTQGLRNRLLIDIADLEALQSSADSVALRHRIAHLKILFKSPWLFHSLDNVGEVVALSGSAFNYAFNGAIRALILRHDIRNKNGLLCNFKGSDWRDAFAAHSNSATGVFSASAGLGHVAQRDINRYLNQPRLRRNAYTNVRVLMRKAFDEVQSGILLDGSTLRVLVQAGSITEEQRARIADYKNRSRLGMGCINPTSPPTKIAPDHRAGELCRHHRCSECSNGVLFDDSADLLVKRYAELIKIQEMIPATTWNISSYRDEMESIQSILDHFDKATVEALQEAYLARFSSGVVPVIDLEGSYER
jgi:hypothetical protein